ncbi:hypothetical protein GGD52_003807 [Agrobacterium tumefaciens]|nr:hypothetical protein [Agrobacterium radiobacter]MBB5589186.1 hypothetical protein [Agrobacterium radiobacter]
MRDILENGVNGARVASTQTEKLDMVTSGRDEHEKYLKTKVIVGGR